MKQWHHLGTRQNLMLHVACFWIFLRPTTKPSWWKGPWTLLLARFFKFRQQLVFRWKKFYMSKLRLCYKGHRSRGLRDNFDHLVYWSCAKISAHGRFRLGLPSVKHSPWLGLKLHSLAQQRNALASEIARHVVLRLQGGF